MLRGTSGLLSLALAALAAPPRTDCPTGVLPAYAHNDYRNARPLTDALALGYRGVEADVFLVDGQLRVAHDRAAARTSGTLAQLYLAPLDSLMAHCPSSTSGAPALLLTLELKEASRPAFDSVLALLARFPGLVPPVPPTPSAASPPGKALEIVLVGWHPPLSEWTAEARARVGVQYQIRRVFDDAMARELAALDPSVRLLSLDYGKTAGRWWRTPRQRRAWIATLRAVECATPDRRLRVYDVPAEGRVYETLLEAGVDIIGTKELGTTRRLLTPTHLKGTCGIARAAADSAPSTRCPARPILIRCG